MIGIKNIALRFVFSFILLSGLNVKAQETLKYEFKVPTINEWQFKPINKYPCLILKAEDETQLKANFKLMPEVYSSKMDLPVRLWMSGGTDAEKQTATKKFIDYWLNYNKKWNPQNLQKDGPDGVGMRGIWRCIHQYDVVQSFGKFTEKDRITFRDSLVKSIELAIGKDAKHPRITKSIGFRHMNIWSDVVLAAGATGLAFPELPQAKDWVQFAMDEINWQLTTGEWDGCWHESSRYHMYELKLCGQFFEMLYNRTGIDMFQHPSVKRMCHWATRFSTPLTTIANIPVTIPNGISLMPAIGDASWAPEEYFVLNFYARHYQKTDPALAELLVWQWQRSGSPILGEGIMSLLIDPALKATAPKTLASTMSKRKGYMVMRDQFNTKDEIWFLQKSGEPSMSGHENADRNSFSLFAYGYPLALDAGSGNYNDPRHRAWHKRTVSHNAVVFEEPNKPNDIPNSKSQKIVTGNILTWKSTADADYSVTDASEASGVERNVRKVLFVKPDYFVVMDELKSSFNSYWLLHTTAENFSWKENSVSCETPWGVNLDVFVVSPERAIDQTVRDGAIGDWMDENTVAIEQRTGQRIKAKGSEKDFLPFRIQKYLAFTGKPSENFLIVLQPHRKATAPLVVKKMGENKMEITCGKRKDVIEFTTEGVKLTKGGKQLQFFN
ncbi:MAG: heparinase II/III domain-containing protein [Bacteroidales bacterium]